MAFKLIFTEKDTEYYDKWLSFYPKRDKQSPFKIQLELFGNNNQNIIDFTNNYFSSNTNINLTKS